MVTEGLDKAPFLRYNGFINEGKIIVIIFDIIINMII